MAITSRNHTHDAASLPGEMAEIAKDVVLLRTELVKLELIEFAENWLNRILRQSTVVVFAGLGGLFVLIAAALAIGDALGHTGWGLLIIGGGLGLGAGVFALVRPKLVDLEDEVAEVDVELLESPPELASASARHSHPRPASS